MYKSSAEFLVANFSITFTICKSYISTDTLEAENLQYEFEAQILKKMHQSD